MRRGSLVQLILVAIAAAAAGTAIALLPNWLPQPASREAGRIHFVFWFLTGICIFIFSIVASVTAYAVVKFRRKPDDDSDGPPIHGHTGLEITWTAIPAILVTAITIVSAIVLAKDDAAGANPLRVNVVAQQFAWSFYYPAYGNKRSGILRLPVHRSVLLRMTSKDVVHSFWVPEFLFKRDVIPGHPNHFTITATHTGTFLGHCSELCGLYHAKMLFTLKVVTPQQFQAYISAQKAAQSSSGSTQ